jgi:ABC-type nitrate/sulfonate/bicarbonate transport system substrate-binding protein
MKKATFVLVLIVCTLLACTPQKPAPTSGAPGPRGTLRFSLTGATSVKDVPWFLALDALREQGYEVQITTFAKSSLIPPALVQEEIDVASANANLVWSAISQGADLRSIVGRVNTSFYFIVTKDIQSCGDLDGKPIAFSTRQSVGYVMFEEYVSRHCQDVQPQLLLISDSVNRVVALQTGEVQGAYLELEEWVQLQDTSPDEFHALINFAREFPEVQISTFSVRREWAQQNPEMLRDFVRELLLAYRRVIDDPQLLPQGIEKHLSLEPSLALRLAEAYLAASIWDPNGQLTTRNVQATLDLLGTGGMLATGMEVESVAELSYLNDVLQEIGRRE